MFVMLYLLSKRKSEIPNANVVIEQKFKSESAKKQKVFPLLQA